MPEQTSAAETIDSLLADLGKAWDPWASVPFPVHHRLFGRGSRHPFSWYLEGRSAVTVTSIADVERWLLGCTTVDDRTLFGEDDYWSHPGEFEVIRMGDCDDHALWAWRKFVELGCRTSLVTGRWFVDGSDELHVFVTVEVDGEERVFESTSKTLGGALLPAGEARKTYRPHFAVNESLETRVFLGSASEILPLPSSWDD